MGQASRKKEERRRLARKRPNVERLLRDHHEALLRLGKSFDEGWAGAALPLAVSVRVIVHDTAVSSSLLAQLGVKDRLRFKDTASHIEPKQFDPIELGSGIDEDDCGSRSGMGPAVG